MLTIQVTPNLSTHIPKLSPHGAFSSGIAAMPPSTSLFHYPRSSSSSSPLSDTETLPPAW